MAVIDGSDDKYIFAKLHIFQNMMMTTDDNDRNWNYEATSVIETMT